MNGIFHTYEVKSFNIEKIQNGEISKIINKGYYTYPLYGTSEEILPLINRHNEHVGFVAIKSFTVLPAEEVSEEDLTEAGLTKEEFDLLMKDEVIATIANIVPVFEEDDECDCGECNCEDSDKEHPCMNGGECTCGGKCKHDSNNSEE